MAGTYVEFLAEEQDALVYSCVICEVAPELLKQVNDALRNDIGSRQSLVRWLNREGYPKASKSTMARHLIERHQDL
jgi:hypothetical protein